MSRARIFVGGCERSGTTLMASLLADAAELLYLPESPFFVRALRAHDHGTPVQPSMRDNWRVEMWGSDFVELVKNLDDEVPPEQLFDHMARLYAEAKGEVHKFERGWVENSPETINAVALIQTRIPGAQHIHMVRDPRAVAASLLAVDFGSTTATTAAEQWKCSVLDGVLAEMEYPDKVVRVRYEDLVADPQVVTLKVGVELGLSVPETWTPTGREVDPFLQRHETLIRRAPTGHRANAWKAELSERQVAGVEAVAENALQMLGYEPIARPALYPRWGPYVDRLVEGPARIIGLLRRQVARLLAKRSRTSR